MSNEVKKKKKSHGAANRRKGHTAEREYANKFKELGFKHCITARLGSKLHDYAGIDLIFIPLNVQIKAGKQAGLKADVELKYIHDRMIELFPPDAKEHVLPKILIHKKEGKPGVKRTEFQDIVSMTWQDFEKIIKKVDEW